jgi:signal transduction histidine kinase/ActR/RegA family two-component response regulator
MKGESDQRARGQDLPARDEVYREQVDFLFRNLPLGLLGSILNSTILGLVLFRRVPLKGLALWYFSIQAISLVRYLTYRKWKQAGEGRPPQKDARLFIGTVFSAGLAWGLLTFIAYPSDLLYQVFIIFVIGGLVAGAAASYAVLMAAYLSYSLPALLPLILKGIIMGGEIGYAMSGMITLYFVLITIAARHIHKMTIKSIVLGHEKDRLLLQLASEKERAEGLNLDLSREIERRREAEEDLKRHRDSLEETVRERTRELKEANEALQNELPYREQMERELLKIQRLESLSTLAGGIAHRYNNLLTGILGNINLIQMLYPSDIKLLDKLSAAERACLEARDLSHKLLNISRGGVPYKSMVNLSELVKDSVSLTLEGAPVSFDFHTTCDSLEIEVDQNQIKQAIQGIVQNSREAMPGGGRIKVLCEVVSLGKDQSVPLPEGEYARITISDHGFGIREQDIEKVFDPFLSGKETGTGLGLAAAYSIIKRHNGYITVFSSEGKGTTFQIYLPLSRGPDHRQEKKGMGKPSPSAMKVLVMDDEDVVRDFAASALAELGCKVVTAENSKEAVERYREARDMGRTFDLVILDLTVPGGHGGMEALGLLREIDPDVRAVVSSGYSDSWMIKNFRDYGFWGALPKPYRLADLRRLIESISPGPSGDTP